MGGITEEHLFFEKEISVGMLLCSFLWFLSNLMMPLLTETKKIYVSSKKKTASFFVNASKLQRESWLKSNLIFRDDWVHVCLLRAFQYKGALKTL